ncbi:MAG: cyclic nucleotide-binding domain-containing protein [Actinomycetota bacterium]
MAKHAFGTALHYDEPPPEAVEDIEALRQADRFRFANELRAWVEVEDGKITNFGHAGRGHIGATTIKLGSRQMTVPAVPMPDIQPTPVVGEGWVKFTQTAGGKTGLPAPRPVQRKPFFQLSPPLAWTTLSLTIKANGESSYEVLGHSCFPRHWIYDSSGRLSAKSGLVDLKTWMNDAFGENTPWGDQDSAAFVVQAESALERQLSSAIMSSGPAPEIRRVSKGANLVEQGSAGKEMFLLLDGVLEVEVNGEVLASLGPGVLVGERALLEKGTRTSTLRALTACKVAVVPPDRVAIDSLAEVALGHQLEYPAK